MAEFLGWNRVKNYTINRKYNENKINQTCYKLLYFLKCSLNAYSVFIYIKKWTYTTLSGHAVEAKF